MAVDYVKSGEPAHMPRELAPRRWPHFMEKTHKPKSQIYISRKILGKLYDQVERVDFVPSFSAPFDDRILDAYNLQVNTLEDAMILKREYDAAINRIMAQHEIRTEFEVWSTFVLHHSNQSKDYKFHEIIGELSASLKDQFREACYKKAGGKDFDHIGPFVAAMYRVTFEEITQALEECHQVKMVGGVETPLRKMIPASMPLMSFPWLFQDILGKIANGTWSGETVSTTHPVQASTRRAQAKKNRTKPEMPVEEDVLETAEGVTHRGEVLGLFEDNLIDYEPDVPDIVPDAKPNSNSSKRGSKVTGFSVDDMLFGVSSLDIGPHENQASVTEVQPRSSLENLFDAPLGAERLFSPIEPGSNRLASEIQVSSSESTSAITPSSSRLNFHEKQYEYKENPAQVNALGNPLKEVRSTQTKAEVLPMISSSRSSSQPQTNLQSEANMDCEEAMSDFEPEEIVHLDTKSSLLDQLAEFD